MGQRQVNVGEPLANPVPHPSLVVRIHEGKEKADGQRFDALFFKIIEGSFQVGLVELGVHGAVPLDALRHHGPEVARDQWLEGLGAEVVAVLFQPLPHLQQVAEAPGRYQANFSALALHQGVGSNGCAVNYAVGLA